MNKKIKAGIWTISSMLAIFSLYYLISTRQYRELQRRGGMVKERHPIMSLEESAKRIKTWEEAEDYLMRHFKPGPFCDEASRLAINLLKDNNDYDCYRVILKRNKRFGHSVCVVYDTETKKYGSLGINAGDCIKPKYDSMEKLINRINRNCFLKYNKYEVADKK